MDTTRALSQEPVGLGQCPTEFGLSPLWLAYTCQYLRSAEVPRRLHCRPQQGLIDKFHSRPVLASSHLDSNESLLEQERPTQPRPALAITRHGFSEQSQGNLEPSAQQVGIDVGSHADCRGQVCNCQ